MFTDTVEVKLTRFECDVVKMIIEETVNQIKDNDDGKYDKMIDICAHIHRVIDDAERVK